MASYQSPSDTRRRVSDLFNRLVYELKTAHPAELNSLDQSLLLSTPRGPVLVRLTVTHPDIGVSGGSTTVSPSVAKPKDTPNTLLLL